MPYRGIASASKTVRVIPKSAVQAPVPVEEDGSCQLRDERPIRKGPFKKKSGIISMEAELPGPIPYKDTTNRHNQGQIAKSTVTLHFDPTDNESTPPRLGALKTRLLVTSYHGSICREYLPTTQDTLHYPGQATYAAGIKVHDILFYKVGWYRVPHTLSEAESLGGYSREETAPLFCFCHQSWISAELSGENALLLCDAVEYSNRPAGTDSARSHLPFMSGFQDVHAAVPCRDRREYGY